MQPKRRQAVHPRPTTVSGMATTGSPRPTVKGSMPTVTAPPTGGFLLEPAFV